MEIPVIFIAAFLAAAGASRPPHIFDSPGYRDSSPTRYFESPPLRSSSGPSFLSSFPSHQTRGRFGNELIVFEDAPPQTYREGKIFFDLPKSSYFPRSRPASFYEGRAPTFSEGLSVSHVYIGPPPPAPRPGEAPRNPTTTTLAHQDGRPPAGSTSIHQSPKSPADPQNQQRGQALASAPPPPLPAHQRQPLSFGGHGSHLSYGDHALGFASVPGAASSDINPLAVEEMSAATRAAASPTALVHSPPTPGAVRTAEQQHQQQSAAPTSSGGQTSATVAVTPSMATAVGATVAETGEHVAVGANKLMSGVESTSSTPTTATSLAPKSNLASAQNPSHPAVPMMVYQTPRTSYDLRTVTQDFPPAAHGQLPLETSEQQQQQQFHIPDVKHNLLIYETKPFALHRPGAEILHQHQGGSVAPFRLNIPAGAVSATLSGPAADVIPMKVAFQNLELARPPVALMAVPHSYASGRSQIDVMSLLKLNAAAGSDPGMPSYYYLQNDQHIKPSEPIHQNIPLGSFYLRPNHEQAKQYTHVNSVVPSGLQLELGGYGGVEYLTSSGNSEPLRPSTLGIAKVGFNVQEQFQSPESVFTKIGYGQSPW